MENKSSPNSWKIPVASSMWPPYTSTGMDSITLASSQQRNATLESQDLVKADPSTSTWRDPGRD